MLHRVYRPKTFDEVVGQEHVVRTLKGALASKRVGHAYLFAGPRGTGKTTLARIFAKALHCSDAKNKPCGTCEQCVAIDAGRSMDLIEIDAASNRTIDDMRQLKESASVAATGGGYKVYLMDEAHMLTREACNAFLKLLEEPPAHVVFLLATTEAHKLLPTILSRVQRFDIKKLTQQQVVQKLQRIAAAEKMQVTDEAFAALASASDGALRDAEVMLTKLASHAGANAVDAETAHAVLGLVPASWHAEWASLLAQGKQADALRFIRTVQQQGADMDQFIRGELEYLRLVMIAKIDATAIEQAGLALAPAQRAALDAHAKDMDGKLLVRTMQALSRARAEMATASIPTLPIELAVLELTTGV